MGLQESRGVGTKTQAPPRGTASSTKEGQDWTGGSVLKKVLIQEQGPSIIHQPPLVDSQRPSIHRVPKQSSMNNPLDKKIEDICFRRALACRAPGARLWYQVPRLEPARGSVQGLKYQSRPYIRTPRAPSTTQYPAHTGWGHRHGMELMYDSP